VKQFREQEARSLASRTAGAPPECATLAAVAVDGAVLGALDVRPPASAGGAHPVGVPKVGRGERPRGDNAVRSADRANQPSTPPVQSDPAGAAVLNVAVSPAARRAGVGAALMRAAARHARAEWSAATLYATVASTNAPARALYARCGYAEAGEAAPGVGGGELGREILLRADARVSAESEETGTSDCAVAA